MNFLDTLKNERIIVSERSDGIVAHPLKPAVCPCVELNRISYKEAWTLQQDIVSARNTGRIQTDVVLILEHEPVFTIGRNGDEKNLKISEAFLNNMNISVIRSERGGDITYHGPGQLVVYPIVKLRNAGLNVKDFVFNLEEIMIRIAGDLGISAERNLKNPGVWVSEKKLGSIGITVRRGISFHGFALNVNLLLDPFDWINPCGFKDVTMTSMRQELGSKISMESIREATRRHFSSIFGCKLSRTDLFCLKRFVQSA